ncbi:LON peptidase substrate-binding domain-containing protein [Pacificimonas sp. WHA3]|uniref:LON peptidase substrate-binding domain-containing protein n=1 Tax=Pacificimonas pallii TaxID=2827236 RepID=A0ABS6SCL1_9SPHN|nr:LON peptidase substrate-binding domain-containing protein [Pacificimonas pallii]MBV7256114.1 LON peptidase substrate-binding domain-containing protein [Pacificimonas pallii]
MTRISAEGLPRRIAIFPLNGAMVLPRGNLPLNIFEPRYLEMVRDAMAGDRMIGMIQTLDDNRLYDVGGLGRITQFTESDDGRFTIILSGITRFRVLQEFDATTPYRQVEADYDVFHSDFGQPVVLDATTRQSLEEILKEYLDAHDLSADWESVKQADDESLVNTLSSVCPFGPAEKQALLEAADLPRRAATLEALMRFAGDAQSSGIGSSNVH